jgi:hypothetical protein
MNGTALLFALNEALNALAAKQFNTASEDEIWQLLLALEALHMQVLQIGIDDQPHGGKNADAV